MMNVCNKHNDDEPVIIDVVDIEYAMTAKDVFLLILLFYFYFLW